VSLSEVISHLPRRTSIRSGVMAELVFSGPECWSSSFMAKAKSGGTGRNIFQNGPHISPGVVSAALSAAARCRRALSPRAVAARCQ
jgi:hypothetical protein